MAVLITITGVSAAVWKGTVVEPYASTRLWYEISPVILRDDARAVSARTRAGSAWRRP